MKRPLFLSPLIFISFLILQLSFLYAQESHPTITTQDEVVFRIEKPFHTESHAVPINLEGIENAPEEVEGVIENIERYEFVKQVLKKRMGKDQDDNLDPNGRILDVVIHDLHQAGSNTSYTSDFVITSPSQTTGVTEPGSDAIPLSLMGHSYVPPEGAHPSYQEIKEVNT